PNGLVLSIDLLAIASENGINVSKFINDIADCLGIENPKNVREAAGACLKKIAKNSDQETKKRINEFLKKVK
ncbi:hypothetical protein HYT84_04750, partial [Candidatus Micrarchaeota archaeon]|nr:hypothetical protein [Candidatus Micrarchaeota archaeon]